MEKFQQLSFTAKLVFVVAGLSVIVGLAAFLYFAINPTKTDDVPTSAVPPSSDTPLAPGEVPIVDPNASPGATPTPTPIAPYDDGALVLMRPDKQAAVEATFNMSPEDIQAAYQQANAGYEQYCSVKNDESSDARKARMAPYFTTEALETYSFPNPVIQDRDCFLSGVFPLSGSGNEMAVNITVRMATIANISVDGTLNDKGEVEDFSSTISLRRDADGVWKIVNIEDKTGAPIVSSAD